MNRVTNRKLKMRDSFTKILPSYNHGEPTALCETKTHGTFKYRDRNPETRKATHMIDR